MMHRPRDMSSRYLQAPAFSIIELVLSLTIMSLVMGAIASVIIFATRTATDDASSLAVRRDTFASLELLRSDLRYAMYITQRSSTSLTVIVADQDGDGLEEVICYAWSGTSGDSLTRSYNGGSPRAVVRGIGRAAFTYELSDVETTVPGPLVSLGESRLAYSHDTAPGSDVTVDRDSWYGQFITPSLSSGAAMWKPSRLVIRCGRNGSPAQTARLRVLGVNGIAAPASHAHASREVAETLLAASVNWHSIAFTAAEFVPAGRAVFASIEQNKGSDQAMLLTRATSTSGDSVVSSDEGSSWDEAIATTIAHELYGYVYQHGSDLTITRQRVVSVTLELQQDSGGRPLRMSVPITNRAMSQAGVWHASFGGDPTLLDGNGDGSGDWKRVDGAAFNTGTLSDGRWKINSALTTVGSFNNNYPTTIEFRGVDYSEDGGGITCTIVADKTASGDAIVLVCTLEHDDNEHQRLTLKQKTGITASQSLFAVLHLDEDIEHTVKLIVLPDQDAVALYVNDAYQATFPCTHVATSNSEGVTIDDTGSGAELGAIRVRNGGSVAP